MNIKDAFLAVEQWLSRRKIWFETVAAIGVSAMTLIVSISSCEYTKSQSELLRIQTEIARQQISPQFIIQTSLEKSPNSEVFDEERMYISNVGGIASPFDVDCVVLARAKATPKDPSFGTTKVKDIYLNNYFGSTIRTAAGQGKLVTIQGYKNNNHFHEIYMQMLDLSNSSDFYVDAHLDYYVRLTYRDSLQKSHIDYYHVNPFSGAERIEEKAGMETFERFKQALRTGEIREFGKLTAQELLDLTTK